MVDHIGIVVADLAASRRFYEAALGPLGFAVMTEAPDGVGFGAREADDFNIQAVGAPATGVHVAFVAETQEAVERFHAAALAAGGRDNGAPRVRMEYSPRYYAAFVLDPDGNNIEAVHHG